MSAATLDSQFAATVLPTLQKYCVECHATEVKDGELDLERFATAGDVRGDLKPWGRVICMLEERQMPPEDEPAPSDAERAAVITWSRAMFDAEARANAGDPGQVVLRRLNNAEYDNTVRDLTGVNLRPASEFPADGAAGEGFTNTGQSLVMSPALLSKYLDAAQKIADHAVLLPDGIRFSRRDTRRDWTDETLAELHAFHRQTSPDGAPPLRGALAATIEFRDELLAGRTTLAAVAAQKGLNAKYLDALWQCLTDPAPALPLDRLRRRWKQAVPTDVDSLVEEVGAWQAMLWKFNKIGSYMSPVWQEAAAPGLVESSTLRLRPEIPAGQSEVRLFLAARSLTDDGGPATVVWERPRLEGGRQPLLLRDLPGLSQRLRVASQGVFADTGRYLAAVVKLAAEQDQSLERVAEAEKLTADVLRRWVEVAAVAPEQATDFVADLGPPAALVRLTKQQGAGQETSSWVNDTSDALPSVVGNASDMEQHIPGTIGPRKVAVHPTPEEFVAIAWHAPVEGQVRLTADIRHAHPACGNGVAWRLEHRRGEAAQRLDDGVIDLGQQAQPAARVLKVRQGDVVLLVIGARDRSHVCDLTAVELTIAEAKQDGRRWDLASDVAQNILASNPHTDGFGNADIWEFLRGQDANEPPTSRRPLEIPRDSILGQWRAAAADPGQADRRAELAEQVQRLLTGERPNEAQSADRLIFDALTAIDSPLLKDVDLSALGPAETAAQQPEPVAVWWDAGAAPPPADAGGAVQFDEQGNLHVPGDCVVELRVPAALLRDRQFAVEGRLETASSGSIVQMAALTNPPNPAQPLEGPFNYVASADVRSQPAERLQADYAAFRQTFPAKLFYPSIVPTDEVICLRLYVREDEPLARLFLSDEQKQQLDRLWAELEFVSQQHRTESQNYPVFMGFVSQDGGDALPRIDALLREPVRQRSETFEQSLMAAEPAQLAAALALAQRAFRRPLEESERAALTQFYSSLREQEIPHEEALRALLTRVLVSPSFLYRVERPAGDQEAQPINEWELASRLSYFLWASMPDDELLAAAPALREGAALEYQAHRMLRDDRVRDLAVQFAGQWLAFRDFDQHAEKSETLFPEFNEVVKADLYRESVLFFEDLFRNDGSVLDLLDADHTFLNERLAAFYGIPGVQGPQWRRVEGVQQYSRGGVLGLGTILATQSGASRTSPVLRGVWLLETLLGEELPQPPPNVPILPDDGVPAEGLTVRQLVERHRSDPQCASCHAKIDPYGFALEAFDTIGRLRPADPTVQPPETLVRLDEQTEFDGPSGLRSYLLTQRKDQFLRNFARKLLGYALGRSVTLSDEPLIDEMLAEAAKSDYRFSAFVMTIVGSRQFREHRGLEHEETERQDPDES